MSRTPLPVRAKIHGWGSLFLGLSALGGICTLLWILSEPSDPDVWRLLGYSPQRWMIILAALSLTGLVCALFYKLPRLLSNTEGRWYARVDGGLATWRADALIVLLFNLRLWMFLQNNTHPLAGAMAARLLPLSALLAILCAQMIAFLLLLRPPAVTVHVRLILAAWAACAAVGAVLLTTHFGLVSIANGWYEYGIPLTHIQWFDLLLAGLVLTRISRLWRTRIQPSRLRNLGMDGILAMMVWLVAVNVWLPMPLPTTWFSPTPLPPNQEVYPSSDASLYDAAAQGIALGTEWARVTAHYKPLYVAFLALAHTAVGYNYADVIRVQTFFLALLPVLLYLSGRLLHSRLAGLLAAAAMILREYNQLLVGSLVTSSNTKLMLSELPTAIGISLLALALIGWLRSPRWRGELALLAGGMIGLTAQIRLQAAAFLPAVMALAALFYTRNWKASLRSIGLLSLGFSLALALLLGRNAWATGQFTLEKPGYMERTLNYAFTPIAGQEYSRGWMMASGFVHNTVQALLVLPSGYHGEKVWTHTRDLSSMFWISESLDLSAWQIFWLLFNLWLVCQGVIAAWQRSRWAALAPAFAFGAYSLASVTGGFSGQRFALPVDWVGYFYGAAGLVWLAESLVHGEPGVHRYEPPELKEETRTNHPFVPALAIAALLLAVGGLLPAVEAFIPVRYGSASQVGARETLNAMAARSLDASALADFQELLNRPETVVLQGVALYPREIMKDIGPGSFIQTDPEVGSPFLTYLYQGQASITVLQPTNGASVLSHAAEVIVAGWPARGRFHAFVTALPGTGEVYFSTRLK